jgi:hypothetical protein
MTPASPAGLSATVDFGIIRSGVRHGRAGERQLLPLAAPEAGDRRVVTSPFASTADVHHVLARLAALPADQRAALARLLAPAADAPAGPTLNDTLPAALERTALRAGGAKGDAG